MLVADIPETVDLEVEYEQEDDESEIEVELEWPTEEDDETFDTAESEVESSVESEDAAEPDAESEDTAEPSTGSADMSESEVVGLVEPGDVAKSRARFELYRDRADKWRWRLVHHNGNIIADGGGGYARKANARKGLRSVRRNAPGALVVEND